MPEVIGPFVSAACDLWKVGSYPCSETRRHKPIFLDDCITKRQIPSPKEIYSQDAGGLHLQRAEKEFTTATYLQ